MDAVKELHILVSAPHVYGSWPLPRTAAKLMLDWSIDGGLAQHLVSERALEALRSFANRSRFVGGILKHEHKQLDCLTCQEKYSYNVILEVVCEQGPCRLVLHIENSCEASEAAIDLECTGSLTFAPPGSKPVKLMTVYASNQSEVTDVETFAAPLRKAAHKLLGSKDVQLTLTALWWVLSAPSLAWLGEDTDIGIISGDRENEYPVFLRLLDTFHAAAEQVRCDQGLAISIAEDASRANSTLMDVFGKVDLMAHRLNAALVYN